MRPRLRWWLEDGALCYRAPAMPVERNEEEELYFAQVDQDARRKLREKLERNAAELEQKRSIAESMKTDDLTVAERVAALGFDGDSARVFDLLPLIHVAWADGTIQRGERAAILRILEQRGIEPGTEAFRTIESLLEERPSDAYMKQSLAVLRDLTGGTGERSQEIVDMCIEIAASAGGFLGIGKRINEEEKALIEDITRALGSSAADSFRDGLDEG
jgi:tellurite resistance protein